jgi:DNA repair protein RadC
MEEKDKTVFEREKKEQLSIKRWAEEDRPREKLLSQGAHVLSDAELLAILIGSGTPSESAVELSRRILHAVENNLNELGRLSTNELISRFKGIGTAKAVTIQAALELGRRRSLSDAAERPQVCSSLTSFHLLSPLLSDTPHEEAWILLANSANRLIGKHRVSQGGAASTLIDPRLILRLAVQSFATGIVLGHNHPSGSLQVSKEDDEITYRLYHAAHILDIRLLDHIVIGHNRYYSYADEGRLPPPLPQH